MRFRGVLMVRGLVPAAVHAEVVNIGASGMFDGPMVRGVNARVIVDIADMA